MKNYSLIVLNLNFEILVIEKCEYKLTIRKNFELKNCLLKIFKFKFIFIFLLIAKCEFKSKKSITNSISLSMKLENSTRKNFKLPLL